MKISFTIIAILLATSLSAQIKPAIKKQTKRKTPSASFPDLGEFDLKVDNSYQVLQGLGLKLSLVEAQLSTTNTSPLGGRAGLTYFSSEGINIYADILVNPVPFQNEFLRDNSLGSVFKTKSERGVELNASYFFKLWSGKYDKNRIMVSKTNSNVTYNWLAKVECQRHFAIAPLLGYESGRKQHQFDGDESLFLNPIGTHFNGATEVSQSNFSRQSSMQDYGNIKLGAMFQISDFLKVDAGRHGKRDETTFIRVGASLLMSMTNSFDDVYSSTYFQSPDQNGGETAFPGHVSEIYILDRFSIDDVNEKRNLGAELFLEWNGFTNAGFKIFARSNPGLKAFPSYDIGGSIGLTIGNIK